MFSEETSILRLKDASRAMEICNACRYCETLCPVFPQITEYRTFDKPTLNYLSNLCHNCKGCYHGCQYAPPHEFDLNIPKIFSEIRVDSYIQYAFPSILGKLFAKNGTVVSILIALCIGLMLIAGAYFNDADSLFVAFNGEGSFFKVIPYEVMTLVSGLICFHVVIAFIVGFKRFWTENGDKMSELADLSLWKYAFASAATLKHLDGGDNGHGCNDINDRFTHKRKWFHHGVMYGFILTLISTTLAAIYHHILEIHAPYDFDSLVVITGTLGGILMVIGCIGLTYIKIKADPIPISQKLLGMDYSFIAMLALVNITGLLLLVLRDGTLMPSLLCIHLGFVLAFFLIMPYCKFVHLLYRLGALLKYAKNQKSDDIIK